MVRVIVLKRMFTLSDLKALRRACRAYRKVAIPGKLLEAEMQLRKVSFWIKNFSELPRKRVVRKIVAAGAAKRAGRPGARPGGRRSASSSTRP